MKELSTLNDYQKKALTYAKYPENLTYIYPCIYPCIGLSGEAGEVSEKVKKILRDKGGIMTDQDRTEIAKELGDVLWYVSVMAKKIGFSLSDIANMNVSKLESRKQRNVLGGSGDNR